MEHKQSSAAKKNAALLRKPIRNAVFSLALPVIINHLFIIALELTDAKFVGYLGTEALAAVTLAGVMVFFLSTFGAGLGIGAVALVSRAYGRGDSARAERSGAQAFHLSLALGIVLGIVGYYASPHLLSFLGAEGEVLRAADNYLKIQFVGLFLMFFMFVAGSVFQGMGDTLTPMKVGAFTSLLNIALDPLLIFGLLGLPRLETTGAALATLISRLVGSALLLLILQRGKHKVRLNRESLRLDWPIIRAIVRVGLPGSLQMLLRSFSAVVLMKVVAFFGPVVIAAYGVGGRLFYLFLFPGFGFSAAAATLVGQNLGAGDPARAQRSALCATWYYFLFLLISGTLVFIFAPQLAAAFNTEAEFVRSATVFFRYTAVGCLALSTGHVFSRAMQGAGETVLPMIMTGLSLYLVQIPLAYYLGVSLEIGETGIWIGNLVGNYANALLMAWIFFKGSWKRKAL